MNRIDYYVGIVLLGLILVLGDGGLRWLSAAESTPEAPKVIAAQEFRLVDAAGKQRGTFTMLQGTMPSLVLQNAEGKGVLGASVLPDGSPDFQLIDSGGKTRADISLNKEGAATIMMLDAAKTARFGISSDANDGSVTTLYRDVKGVARIGITTDAKDGHGWIAFTAPDGKTTRLMKGDGDVLAKPAKPKTP